MNSVALALLLVASQLVAVPAQSFNGNGNGNGNGNANQCETDLNTYDYIVVGSGPAGSMIASKLSANPSNRVLVLEQGNWENRNPKLLEAENWFGNLLFDPEIEIGYTSTPQPSIDNKVLDIKRAMVVGGCAMHNAMTFELGPAVDWDLMGFSEWSFKTIQPLWNKIRADYRKVGAPYTWHGFGENELLEAARLAGYPTNQDFNNGNPFGAHLREFSGFQINETQARRVSAWTEYMRPALKRTNLKVETLTRALKVVFQGKRAVGVLAENQGSFERTTYYARKEVILSGGAIDTPRLLKLSGVGPAAELRRFNIPVVADLPGVGENLMNQYFFHMNGPPLKEPFKSQYFAQPKPAGLFSNTGIITFGRKAADGRPKTQLEIGIGPNWVDFNDPALLCYLDAPGPGLTSRGSVKLASADPYVFPLIDLAVLKTEEDMAEVIAALRECRNILYQSPLLDMTTGIDNEIMPGKNTQTDAEFRRWIIDTVADDFHLEGTAKMGVSTDPMAVVDRRLRVFKVSGLRVADASVFAKLISSNPTSATMVVGSRVADMILQDNA